MTNRQVKKTQVEHKRKEKLIKYILGATKLPFYFNKHKSGEYNSIY